jgi:hypothetical protein
VHDLKKIRNKEFLSSCVLVPNFFKIMHLIFERLQNPNIEAFKSLLLILGFVVKTKF